jgi:hypothetical protein
MNFVAIKAPAAGVALTGEALELCDAALGVVSAGDGLQVVADQLVEAFAEGFRLLAGAGDELVIEGESDVHGCILTQYMWTRVMCQFEYVWTEIPAAALDDRDAS